ncbi:M60 family metallopeptidase [Brevibacillus ginsengisoli]|uniref:M60 family metallopeptidase n=1 Tax=Brevibacillus ginsengisoli TaxID=363854 RepID=UPI003CEE712A
MKQMNLQKIMVILLLLSLALPFIPASFAVDSALASSNDFIDNDLNTLYTDLPSYPDYQNASTVTVFGPDAFAVSLDQGKYPLAGASRYGNGRIIAAGAENYFNPAASIGTTDGKITRNLVLWLTEDKAPNPTTGNTNRYSDALQGTQKLKLITKNKLTISTAQPIEQVVVSSWTSQALDPLVYPVAFVSPKNVSQAEAEALNTYVKNGGSIIVAYKGWVMEGYPTDAIRAQAQDPQNVKVTDYPVQWLLNQAGLGINGDSKSINDPNPKPTLDKIDRVNLSNLIDELKQVEDNSKTFMDFAIEGEKAPQDVWSRINSSVSQGWKSIVPNCPYLASFKRDSDHVMSSVNLPLDRLQKPYTSSLIEFRVTTASMGETGVTFADADVFPGKVDSTTPRVDKTIAVNMEYANYDFLRMSCPPGHWVSTGTYAPAGSEITIDVPLDEPDLSVQIGAHTDDLTGTKITKWDRLPKVVVKKGLKPGLNRISSPYGGLVYIIPNKSKPGRVVNVTIGGVIEAPYFVLGKTSEQEWKDVIRNNPAPWAELESHHIILTIPSDDIRSLDNPQDLMEKWDEIYGLYENLVGLAPDKPLPHTSIDWPYRYVADKQISAGWMHSGYPIMLYQGSTSKSLVNLNDIQHNGWGFWHELGHNFQMSAWTWGDNVEVTNNLHSLHVQEYYGNESRLKSIYSQAAQYVVNPDPNKDFESISDLFVRLDMFAQLKYAYGWDFYTKLHTAYREMDKSSLPADTQQKKDLFVITTSQIAGENLLEFFDHWGFKYSSKARDSVLALNLPKPAWPIWNLTADIDKPQTIPQFQMSATATSEELVSANNAASMVLDGNTSTIWHTKWNLSNPLPQSVTLKLNGTYVVNSISYLPRQSGTSGNITDYSVFVSNDGTNFTQVATGKWANDKIEKKAEFPATPAAYVKLVANQGVGGWASAAEMNVYYSLAAMQ